MHVVNGTRIVDSNTGKEVVWRSVGGSFLCHAGDRYQEAWQKHLPEIQAMGLNSFRLAFKFPWDTLATADDLDLAKMEWVVNFLAQNGVKSILDNHGGMGFGSQQFYDSWVEVAQYFRNNENVVGYEFFNEPGNWTWDPSIANTDDVRRAYAELTRRVRTVDPNHIVIWMGVTYYIEFRGTQDLQPNVVYTVHSWPYKDNWHEFYTFEQASLMLSTYLVEMRSQFNAPFWLGETGCNQPADRTNYYYLLAEQELFRCEEQVIGWSLWMGRTEIDKPWNLYTGFFPLKVFNRFLVRKPYVCPVPTLRDYVIEKQGVDAPIDRPRRIPWTYQMWHNNDFMVLRPGIIVGVITKRKLADGTVQVVSHEKIAVRENLKICNEEGTAAHPGDWNILVYPIRYAPSPLPSLLLFAIVGGLTYLLVTKKG